MVNNKKYLHSRSCCLVIKIENCIADYISTEKGCFQGSFRGFDVVKEAEFAPNSAWSESGIPESRLS